MRYSATRSDLVEVERATLIATRKRGDVDNKVLRRLQLTLDMAQTELERMAGDADDIGEEVSELGTSPPPAVTSPPAPRDRRAAP
ncbi:hypothetical protein WPS_30530 [Vulcanimicrobium alpinum]|uniref:Uncharacterized protein n=1 Tax=Vulcanimicrobium alpinum TaxID=3016050 RepID=A0AAN1Y0H3_UNVUL|nr:hypothetical protein [Vulcanimicrobium alpinum]BDE07777.1 hypothetical protein WPS_30530 [Vulcanimicrobium alpinum]